MSVHAAQRRRLYLAMRNHPEGITSKDFAAFPAIDGEQAIPRVAARIKELREEHTIPQGIKDGDGFAIYRLEPERDVVPLTPKLRSMAGPGGGVIADWCQGCLSNHRPGIKCPHGHRMVRCEVYAGPVNERCQQEVRRAA